MHASNCKQLLIIHFLSFQESGFQFSLVLLAIVVAEVGLGVFAATNEDKARKIVIDNFNNTIQHYDHYKKPIDWIQNTVRIKV